jgi:alpha,alpha-trehalase
MKAYPHFLLAVLLLPVPSRAWDDPAVLYGELFRDVQRTGVFADSKKFPDCTPRLPPSQIVKEYAEAKKKGRVDLRAFVAARFDTALAAGDDTLLLLRHIDMLWSHLTRDADAPEARSGSLIPLPRPYVVPGGRFRELYYWDSYFTMLGLAEAGRYGLFESMLENFRFLIDTLGHIPNGNRTYYASRSQPPFLSLMVELYARVRGEDAFGRYLAPLEKEYAFWMKGRELLRGGVRDTLRVVRLPGGEILNRYWDGLCTPRPESYREDVETAENAGRGRGVFRDIRAAAESGWDFSSRWLDGRPTLAGIRTTAVVPVDLNCLLYNLESLLGRICRLRNDTLRAAAFDSLARSRRRALLACCWDEKTGFFFDYDFRKERRTPVFSMAGLYPLFLRLADSGRATRAVRTARERLLRPGGFVTTDRRTGQQWDAPNGWAPLQWIAYVALCNYGEQRLAADAAQRWIGTVARVFFATGRLTEKYNVEDPALPGGGGEYPLQDGFGWTNGVFLTLWNRLKKGT